MSATLVAVVATCSATAGAALATAVTRWWLTIRYDLHDYHQAAVRDDSVRKAWADADHEHRLRLRWERRALEARAHIGGLVLELAERDRRLRRLTRPRRRRRSPVPVYGRHRQAVPT